MDKVILARPYRLNHIVIRWVEAFASCAIEGNELGIEMMGLWNNDKEDEFVKKATAFAQNLDALEKIRFSMRQRMTANTLCNPKAYAQSVEAAYRKMWHKWCSSKGVEKDIESSSDTELLKTV